MIARMPVRSRLDVAAPWISTAARLVLAAVLVAAGALKVLDPQSSVQAVRAYDLLPEGLAHLVGWGLPFVELAVGLLLGVGLFTRTVAAAAGALLVAFVIAVASAAVRGLSIDCGCFGGGGQVAPGQTRYGAELVRDVGLVLLAAWLVWRPASRFALDRAEHEDAGDDLPSAKVGLR